MNSATPQTERPRYFAGALNDVLPSVVSALGVPRWSGALELPRRDAYVVFLIDGLGWNLLQQHREEAPYLASLIDGASPLTCGVPSTTATSLTSMGTGLAPGAHGVVGFTSRIPGTDQLLDALRWDPWVDPRQWQRHDTVFGRARVDGVAASVVSKRAFKGSGLTEASQRGADYYEADSDDERVAAVLRASSEPRSLVYVYAGELDAAGHRSGSNSWAWIRELALVDSFAQRLRDSLPLSTALVVTADHGMVDVGPDSRLDVDMNTELLQGVSLFGGEARFRHLYCDSGAVGDVVDRWRERLGTDAWVLTRDEAIAEGWFGSVEADVRPRLGDVMVASLGDVAVMSTTRFPHEAKLIGLHGSLTADEMLIPLLVDAP